MKARNWTTYLGILAVLGMMSCGSNRSEAQGLRFCPADIEADTREALDLEQADEVTLDQLFARLNALGLTYEEAKSDNVLRKCGDVSPIPNAQTFKVYAGVDASKNFARNYLVVADAKGLVRYIEARHAYRAP